MSLDLSERGHHLKTAFSDVNPYFYKLAKNEYIEVHNPSGIINLAVAENMLCEMELVEKLKSVQTWNAMNNYYPPDGGDKRLKETIADFYMDAFHLSNAISTDRMIITTGAHGCFVLLSYLFTDPNDVILIPSPYYMVIDFDVAAFTGAKTIQCPLLGQDTGEFRMTVDIFKQGYEDALSNGLVPKAIIIVNPHNPLGDVYNKETILPILEFAASKKLHVFVDEIYALSTFNDDEVSFQSILSYEHLPDPGRTHHLWSFSKDFALSGARVGVVYFGREEYASLVISLNYLLTPPGVVQETLASMLADKQWTHSYLSLNKKRLKDQYDICKRELATMGVIVRPAQSSFFLWVDLRSFLHCLTFEEERHLMDFLFDYGVFGYGGGILSCAQPGWFRFVYALQPSLMQEALKRLHIAFATLKAQQPRTACVWGANGVSGSAMVTLLTQQPHFKWNKIICISLQPNKSETTDERIRFIQMDLLKVGTHEIIKEMEAIGGKEITDAYHYSFIETDNHEEMDELNKILIEKALDATTTVARGSIKTFSLQTGYNYYGIHLESQYHAPKPFAESATRHNGPSNFYYTQEDMLREYAENFKFTYSITRPPLIIGVSKTKLRNFSISLALYASVQKLLEKPLIFPGNEITWNLPMDYTSAANNANFQLWVSTNEKAANEAFNIHNGDTMTFCSLWPHVEKYFGFTHCTQKFDNLIKTPLGDCQLVLKDYMTEHRQFWHEIATKYNLDETPYSMATWWFADEMFNLQYPCIGDMTKARTFGWSTTLDTVNTFFQAFDKLKELKAIPPT